MPIHPIASLGRWRGKSWYTAASAGNAEKSLDEEPELFLSGLGDLSGESGLAAIAENASIHRLNHLN
jgi:hypothetical protein